MQCRNVRIILLLAMAVLLIGGRDAQVAAAVPGKPIVIGAPIPRASAYGQNGEGGMLLAVEEINAAGVSLSGVTIARSNRKSWTAGMKNAVRAVGINNCQNGVGFRFAFREVVQIEICAVSETRKADRKTSRVG